jgi:hypothetical protein
MNNFHNFNQYLTSINQNLSTLSKANIDLLKRIYVLETSTKSSSSVDPKTIETTVQNMLPKIVEDAVVKSVSEKLPSLVLEHVNKVLPAIVEEAVMKATASLSIDQTLLESLQTEVNQLKDAHQLAFQEPLQTRSVSEPYPNQDIEINISSDSFQQQPFSTMDDDDIIIGVREEKKTTKKRSTKK